jgi:recombinational DNA repair protein (RecF pathway)
LGKAVFAAFPLELAAKVAQENEPSLGLYAALVHGLESMARWDGDARTHAAWQVLQLLTEAGFPPDLGDDSRQRKRAGKARFSYDAGIVDVGTRSDCALSAEAVTALRTLARDRDQCPTIPGRAVGEGFKALRHYVTRQLESDFRSLRVIDQVFG